jgi:type IV pilus assembly protein PilA
VGNQRHTHEQGFTLVELMVVVIILGVIVAIAIPVYQKVTGVAGLNTCMGNQRTIEGSVSMYRVSGADMWTQTAVLDGNATADTCDALVPGYIKVAPKCPGSELYYLVDANGLVVGDQDSTAGFFAGHRHY